MKNEGTLCNERINIIISSIVVIIKRKCSRSMSKRINSSNILCNKNFGKMTLSNSFLFFSLENGMYVSIILALENILAYVTRAGLGLLH